MHLTPSGSHEDASIHTQSFMWLWVVRHLDRLEEEEEEEDVSDFSPLRLPSDWTLNSWARTLLDHIPATSACDREQVYRTSKVFFSWCSMYLTTWNILVDFRLTFEACCPLERELETNTRDAQFIVWFVNECLHTFLAMRPFYEKERRHR